MLAQLESDPDFLNCIIICNESWIYHFDPTTKRESLTYCQRGELSKKKVHQAKSVGKVMLIAFHAQKGVAFQHIVPWTNPKTTVNKEYYISILKNLYTHIQRKQPGITKYFTLNQDNALLQTVALTKNFFSKFNIKVHPYPSYSPNLLRCSFWLFLKHVYSMMSVVDFF